jgi:hypothetical protein
MTDLRQSTAVNVLLGPFLDDTDFKTAETGLTLSQADIQLSKNAAAFAQKNESTSATHRTSGHYMVPLDATDTNTLGMLRIEVVESGALPVWRDFMVLTAAAWDSLYAAALGAGTADSGTTTTLVDSALTQANNDHWKGAMLVIKSGTMAGMSRKITGFTAASDTVTFAPALPSAISTEDYEIWPATDYYETSISSKVDTVDDFLDTEIAALTTAVSTIDDFLDTEIAAIKAKTDNLPADPADASDIAAAMTLIDDFVDTEVAAIKAKTDQLTFTSGSLDANVTHINDAALTGDGDATPWGPA